MHGVRRSVWGRGGSLVLLPWMATAMVMQMRRNMGFMFRETGQAMERLGMSMMGDYSYMEPRKLGPETEAIRSAGGRSDA